MMKEIFYNLMQNLCWLLELIHDNMFPSSIHLFYPSLKWEILYENERAKKAGGKTWKL